MEYQPTDKRTKYKYETIVHIFIREYFKAS
jgi:hypothetical protein